jgi:hypothetical protein
MASKNKSDKHGLNNLVKAYNNYEFLNSPPARVIRVLAEMVEPLDRFRRHNVWNTVVFFGSARALPMAEARKRLKNIEAAIKNTRKPSLRLKKELELAKRGLGMARYYEDALKLSEKLTRWFKEVEESRNKRFVICTGGGPGIMEAANRGAKKAGGKSVGLNISLPMEQEPNRYQTPELSLEFHYFFIRKFWFFYLGKALVVFPGGFGTLDEFFELLTLIQTHKTNKPMPVVLYGSEYWKDIVNIEQLVKWGTVSAEDLKLYRTFDRVEPAFEYLREQLLRYYVDVEYKKKTKR